MNICITKHDIHSLKRLVFKEEGREQYVFWLYKYSTCAMLLCPVVVVWCSFTFSESVRFVCLVLCLLSCVCCVWVFSLIFSSIFLGLSFIFGPALRDAFEATLLIFAGIPLAVSQNLGRWFEFFVHSYSTRIAVNLLC